MIPGCGGENLESLTRRLHELADLYVKLYFGPKNLPDLFELLVSLLPVSIVYLWLSGDRIPSLLKLVNKGTIIKVV